MTAPAPTQTPELQCPAPVSSAQDEEYKRLIEEKFGIILADTTLGRENWPSVHIQIVYGALSRINDALRGNLNSMLGVHSTLFYHFSNSAGDGFYSGKTFDVRQVNFYVVNTFPYHLIYHEMGHLLDNAQGD